MLRQCMARKIVSRYMSNERPLSSELGQFYLGKRTDKIEHEGMGTFAKIEVSQDADNPDQRVKLFLNAY